MIDQLSKEYKIIKRCAGIHPVPKDNQSVGRTEAEDMFSYIRQHHDDIVCIGECGLDFTPRWASSATIKDEQRYVLQQQVALSLYALFN